MKDFRQLFIQELKDIYSAEKQIEAFWDEMIQTARNPKLKELFQQDHIESKKHLKRLESAAEELGADLADADCDAMKGILKECKKAMKMNYLDEVSDAALIAMAQRMMHYEIAVYGVLKAFCRSMKWKEMEKLLDVCSLDERHSDKKLTEMAQGTLFGGGINGEACKRRSA